MSRLVDSESLRPTAAPFFLSRLFVVLLVIGAHAITFDTVPAREGENHNPRLTFDLHSAAEALRCTWSSADASWYFGIAENGYSPGPFTAREAKNWVFFPLFPLLIHGVNSLTHSSLFSGIILSNLCFFSALILLGRLGAAKGLNPAERERMMWLVCFFPASYFFSSPLTESLFFLLLTAVWLAVERRQIILSGLLFLLLASTRPTGLLLLPAYAALLAEKRTLLTFRGLLSLCIAPLGAAAYVWYLGGLTGNFFAFQQNQPAWGRGDGMHVSVFLEVARSISLVMTGWIFNWLSIAALILSALAAGALVRRKRFSEALLVATPPWFGLLTGTLLSLPRFLLPLFPLYFVLARWADTSQKERCLLAAFLALFAIMTALYGHHVTAAMA